MDATMSLEQMLMNCDEGDDLPSHLMEQQQQQQQSDDDLLHQSLVHHHQSLVGPLLSSSHEIDCTSGLTQDESKDSSYAVAQEFSESDRAALEAAVGGGGDDDEEEEDDEEEHEEEPAVCRICGRADDRPVLRFLPVEYDMAAIAAAPHVQTFALDIGLHVFCGKTASILPAVNQPDLEILTKAGIKNKHGIGPEVNAALSRTRCAILHEGTKEKHFYLVREFEANLAVVRHTHITFLPDPSASSSTASSSSAVPKNGCGNGNSLMLMQQQQQQHAPPPPPPPLASPHSNGGGGGAVLLDSPAQQLLRSTSGTCLTVAADPFATSSSSSGHFTSNGNHHHHVYGANGSPTLEQLESMIQQQQQLQLLQQSSAVASGDSSSSTTKLLPVKAAAGHVAIAAKEYKVRCECGGTHLSTNTAKGVASYRNHVSTKRHQKYMQDQVMYEAAV